MRTEAAVFWSTNSVVQKKSVSQHLQQFAMGEKMAFLSRSSEKKINLITVTNYRIQAKSSNLSQIKRSMSRGTHSGTSPKQDNDPPLL